MNKFRLNTGVKIWDNPHILGGVDSGNGTVVIPFEADAPKDSKLAFLCDSPDLNKDGKYLVCEVKNSKIKSKFVYFFL